MAGAGPACAAAGQEVEWLLSFAHSNHHSTIITLFPLLPHPHLSSHFHRIPYLPVGLLFPVRAGRILIYKTTHFLQEIVFGQKSPTNTFLSCLLLLPLRNSRVLESPMLFARTSCTVTCPTNPPTQPPAGHTPPGLRHRHRHCHRSLPSR